MRGLSSCLSKTQIQNRNSQKKRFLLLFNVQKLDFNFVKSIFLFFTVIQVHGVCLKIKTIILINGKKSENTRNVNIYLGIHRNTLYK